MFAVSKALRKQAVLFRVSATQFKHLRSRPLHSQLDDWFRQLPPELK